jgi:hypothetical protein
VVDAMIGGRKIKVLIDLGCLKNFLSPAFTQTVGFTRIKKKESYTLYIFNDKSVKGNKGQVTK